MKSVLKVVYISIQNKIVCGLEYLNFRMKLYFECALIIYNLLYILDDIVQ